MSRDNIFLMNFSNNSLPVGPLVAWLEAIELTEPLLIDTDECWEWPRDDATLLRELLLNPWYEDWADIWPLAMH